MIIRQGDLALIPTTRTHAAPTKLTTLAIGEDSGHAHAIVGALLDGVLRLDDPADLVVEPPGSAWRHAPITVPAGNYIVVIQQEYTPAGARRVED